MEQEGKISGAQGAVLLFLCRIFSLLTLTLRPEQQVNGGTALFALVFAPLSQLLVILPGWLLLRRFPDRSLPEIGVLALGKWAKVFSFLLWGMLVLLCAGTVSEFQFFLSASSYENPPVYLFAALLLAAAGYGAYLGLEAFARFSLFVLGAFLLSFGLIGGSLLPEIRLNQLLPPLAEGWEKVGASAWAFVAKDWEALLFLLLAPRLRRGKKSCYAAWNLLYLAAAAGMIFLSSTVLGEYGGLCRYPFFTLASLTEISALERLDSLHMAVWSFLAFLRTTLTLWLAKEVWKSFAPKKWAEQSFWFSLGAVAGLSFVLTGDVTRLSRLGQGIGTGIPVLLFLVALPLLYLIAAVLRKKGKPAE